MITGKVSHQQLINNQFTLPSNPQKHTCPPHMQATLSTKGIPHEQGHNWVKWTQLAEIDQLSIETQAKWSNNYWWTALQVAMNFKCCKCGIRLMSGLKGRRNLSEGTNLATWWCNTCRRDMVYNVIKKDAWLFLALAHNPERSVKSISLPRCSQNSL